MLVSIGILMGMMAMMAMVFTTATRASGQAQVSTALYRQLRQVAASIEDELAAVVPGDSIMAVAGVSQEARRTPDDATTNMHRADMLMLVARRAFEPYVYQPAGNDVFDTRRLVVYGHANIGMLDPDTTVGGWLGVRYLEEDSGPSPIPASQWHLARRVIGFPAEGALSGNNVGPLWINQTTSLVSPQWTGAVDNIDQYADVYGESFSNLWPSPEWQGFFRYGAGNVLEFAYLNNLPLNESPTRAFLVQGSDELARIDGNWYRYGTLLSTDPPQVEWERELPSGSETPQKPATDLDVRNDVLSAVTNSAQTWFFPRWFRDVGSAGRGRSWLDPSPPAGLAQRMAPYFLPGCMDFKVELTWDDPREIAVDPDTQEPILFEWTGDPATDPQTPVPQPIEWETVPDGEIWVWSQIPTRTSNYTTDGDLRDMASPKEQRWPRAIRITLRAVDPAGRLSDPVTWTITHAWD